MFVCQLRGKATIQSWNQPNPDPSFGFSQDSHRYGCDCSRCVAVGVALQCSPQLLGCGGSEAAPLGMQNTKIINTHVRMNELQILPKAAQEKVTLDLEF